MDPVLQLYGTLQVLRDKGTASVEELADAAILATAVLGGDDLLARVRESSPHDALAHLHDRLVAAHRADLDGGKKAAAVDFLATPAARGALAIAVEDSQLGPKFFAALANDRPRLRELEARKCRLKPPDLATLLDTPIAAHLERLSLGNNQLGDPGAAILAATDALPRLRAIDLGYTRISADALTAALAGPLGTNLRGLQLSTDKGLGSSLGAIVAKRSRLPHLVGVRTYGLKLTNGGLAALVDDPPYRLRRLVILEGGIGEIGCAALAASPQLADLEELRFRFDPITDKAIESLVTSPHLARLRRLQASQCRLTLRGVGALCDRGPLLDELDLGTNAFEPPGPLLTIAASRLGDSLRHLHLYGAKGGDLVLERLSRRPEWFPKLETLGLQNTDLTDAGLEHLARWPGFAHLRRLLVGTNRVTDAGIAHLAAVADRRLEALECWQTGITPAFTAAHLPGVRADHGMVWNQFAPWFD